MTETAFQLVGHDTALDEIRAALASGRMPHAWLIVGIEGIGKATLAKHIAQFVLAAGTDLHGQSDPNLYTAKLVDAETHPDLLIIRRPLDEKTGELRHIIPTDEVLKVITFLHKTPTHGGWRVVLIDEAHTLNRHGQNAILKIIEEPPPQTLILITVTTPGVLLPTIRSRVRILPLAPLDATQMRNILHRTAPQTSSEDITAVIDLSGGSIGFALKILRAGALPLYREMMNILVGLPKMDISRLHKLADQVARKNDSESFDVLTTLLIDHLRLAVHSEAKGQRFNNVHQALNIWEQTRATFALSESANLDRKLALINSLCEIRGRL